MAATADCGNCITAQEVSVKSVKAYPPVGRMKNPFQWLARFPVEDCLASEGEPWKEWMHVIGLYWSNAAVQSKLGLEMMYQVAGKVAAEEAKVRAAADEQKMQQMVDTAAQVGMPEYVKKEVEAYMNINLEENKQILIQGFDAERWKKHAKAERAECAKWQTASPPPPRRSFAGS